jgi:hypothetical protein
LTRLTTGGLATIIKASEVKCDNLHQKFCHVAVGALFVHEKCRKAYNDVKNVKKVLASAKSVAATNYDVEMVEVDTFPTAGSSESLATTDVVSEINVTGMLTSQMRPFSFTTDCFICGLVLKSKYAVRRVNSGNVKVILQLCNESNEPNADAMKNRIRDMDLLVEGASYHRKCYLALSRHARVCAVTPSNDSNNRANEETVLDTSALDVSRSTLTLDMPRPTRSHAEYLQYISMLNGLTYVNTVGGGNCFFDAIRFGLRQYDLERSIVELRELAATELLINRHLYEPLYSVEDDDQRQAPTYALFVERTLAGSEWATELTVSAMARGLNMVVRVISTGHGFDGRPDGFSKRYEDGVTQNDRILTVGYKTDEAHYVALVSQSCQPSDAARSGTRERLYDARESHDNTMSKLCDRRVTRSSSLCESSSMRANASSVLSFNEYLAMSRTQLATSQAPSTGGLDVENSDSFNETTERFHSQSLAPQESQGIGNQTSSLQDHDIETCGNCLRRSTNDFSLEFNTVDSGRFVGRQFRLLRATHGNVTVCSSCVAYLSPSTKSTHLWQHGWPSIMACLLTQSKYSNISGDLWGQLPLRLRQSWSDLGLTIDVPNDNVFADFTQAIDRHKQLTESGHIKDFVSAMDEYAFPCVKCPAGCFAYVDECRPVPFIHYINWKFGLRLLNSNSAFLKGARADWPLSSLELNKFMVRPGLTSDKNVGLSFLICRFHGKGLFTFTVHVPTNPVLGHTGLQYPDVSAAAVLTPNVIRAGRMGRWTNSNHVVAAVGGYGGISTSSIAVKYDSIIVDDRLAASSCLAMRHRSDIYHIYQQRSAELPSGVDDMKAMLNWYDRFVRPDARKIQQSLAGSTYVQVADCFEVMKRMAKQDTDADEPRSGYTKHREFESLGLIFAHPPDSFGCHPIALERSYDITKQPMTGMFLHLLVHCPAIHALVLRGLQNRPNEFVVKLLRFVKLCAGETRNSYGYSERWLCGKVAARRDQQKQNVFP